MEKNFIGYLLDALEPDETRAVEAYLSEHPESLAHLERLRGALTPLEVDGADELPPDDLYIRTLATVAEHVVRSENRTEHPRETPVTDFIRNYARLVEGVDLPDPHLTTTRPAEPLDRDGRLFSAARRNVVAGFGLTLALLAVAIPAVLTFREHQQLAACQNNLRLFHESIAGYSSDRQGRLPQIAENQPAGAFITELAATGRLSPDARPSCPATGHAAGWRPPTGEMVAAPDLLLLEYAYTLGYRDVTGRLWGLSRYDHLPDTLPILSDAPIKGLRQRIDGVATAANHRLGQNVLFLTGNARFCTNALVGPDGDNIFCNQNAQINAGINCYDGVLGRAEETP